MTAHEVASSHSAFSFQLNLFQRQGTIACRDDKTALVDANDFASLAANVDNRWPKNLQLRCFAWFFLNQHERARPWIKRSNFSFDYLGALGPIDPASFAIQLRRVSGQRV